MLFLREDDRCEEGGEGMRTTKNEDKLLRKNQNHSMFLNERGSGLLPLIESWIITDDLLEKTLASSFSVRQALPYGVSLRLPLAFRHSAAALKV